jgi:hypothetical protein
MAAHTLGENRRPASPNHSYLNLGAQAIAYFRQFPQFPYIVP